MDVYAVSAPARARITNIVTRPKLEWPAIAAEPRDVAGLYRSYIVPLAAVPAVCRLIGMSVVGIAVPFVGYYRVGIATALTQAIVQYVLSLVGVYVAAIVIARLAPSFQSEADAAQATKLVAYSMTPIWVAGVLYLVPALGVLVILAALWSIYVFYVGVAPVMKTPPDKVIPYVVVSAVVIVAVYVVIALIAAAVMPLAILPNTTI